MSTELAKIFGIEVPKILIECYVLTERNNSKVKLHFDTLITNVFSSLVLEVRWPNKFRSESYCKLT